MELRFAVVGGVASLHPAASRAAAAACHLGVPGDRSGDIQLAVHECLANALEHGHAGDGTRPIDVEVARGDHGTVLVRVTDDALGGGGSTAGDPERGRGRALVYHLADRVGELTTSGGTTVTMWWSVTPGGSGSPLEVEQPAAATTETAPWRS